MFMGMCLVPESNELLLVMELMEKGSLHDIIHNPKVYFFLLFSNVYLPFYVSFLNLIHSTHAPTKSAILKLSVIILSFTHNFFLHHFWAAFNNFILKFFHPSLKGIFNCHYLFYFIFKTFYPSCAVFNYLYLFYFIFVDTTNAHAVPQHRIPGSKRNEFPAPIRSSHHSLRLEKS